MGNFSYLDYLQNAYGNQLIGRFDGMAHFRDSFRERLTWVLQDDYGQAALDPFAPTTPTNLENVNYVSTGPDLAMRVGGTGFREYGRALRRAQYAMRPVLTTAIDWLGSVAWGRGSLGPLPQRLAERQYGTSQIREHCGQQRF